MSDKLHLLIPGAVLPADAGAPAPDLPPNLRALLSALAPAERIECAEDSPSTPFELALARANGLPGEPGHLPWAAFETGTVGTPCAWVKLCHWQVGADNITLSPAEDLALDEATAQTLLAAMAPYFAEDGITLAPCGKLPGVWLATGEPLRTLRTVSMDKLAGVRLTPAVLDRAASLRRLQNEMQMLLYTHPATEARERAGLPPVNSFWVGGAGVLEQPLAPAAHVAVEPRMAQPALRRNTDAHAEAWREADSGSCAVLLSLLRAGGRAHLTLCGENAAQTFGPARTSFLTRLQGKIGLQTAWNPALQL